MREFSLGASPVRAGLNSLLATCALLVPFNFPLLVSAPEKDSFFTLDPAGRAGLALLSVALLAVLYAMLAVKSRWLRKRWSKRTGAGRGALIAVDIGLGWLIYLLAHHLSPQLYYSYYLILFDGLPVQWVIEAKTSWQALGTIVVPGPKDSLSEFLACAGFWAVLLYTLMLHSAALDAPISHAKK